MSSSMRRRLPGPLGELEPRSFNDFIDKLVDTEGTTAPTPYELSSSTSKNESDVPRLPPNPRVLSFIRDDWIRKQLRLREHEYTEPRSLKCFVGTWNVNAKKPGEDITSWLFAGSNRSSEAYTGGDSSSSPSSTSYSPVIPADASGDAGALQPDLYVIGFQEIVDLNAANVAFDAQSAARSSQWQEHIETALNGPNPYTGNPPPVGGEKYMHVMSQHLVGILLCVFVKAKHRRHLVYEQSATAAVGIMGVVGNKGGVSIRFRLYDSTLCFICSHLAAHRGNVAGNSSFFFFPQNEDVFSELLTNPLFEDLTLCLHKQTCIAFFQPSLSRVACTRAKR